MVQLGRRVAFRKHPYTITWPSLGNKSVDFYFLCERPRSYDCGWFRQDRIEGITASRPWALNTQPSFRLSRKGAGGLGSFHATSLSSSLYVLDLHYGKYSHTLIKPHNGPVKEMVVLPSHFTGEETEALGDEGNLMYNQDYSEYELTRL